MLKFDVNLSPRGVDKHILKWIESKHGGYTNMTRMALIWQSEWNTNKAKNVRFTAGQFNKKVYVGR